MSISASEARRTLFPLIEQVNDDRTAVEIVSRRGNAVLMSADEYAAWQETAYLFRSPANARRLLDAYERAREDGPRNTISSGRTEVRLAWDPSAREDYTYWQAADRRVLKRVNALIDACLRDPFGGIGKPEQLRYGAPGAWSRRITEEHRLVYLVDGDDLVILQARYHY